MHITRRIARALLRHYLPPPVKAHHMEYSMLYSVDDDVASASPRLIALAVDAIQQAQTVLLAEVTSRFTQPPYYTEIWPGEHYKLLAGLVRTLQPTSVIEIGTAGGLGALTMKRFLPTGGKLVTFDIVPWRDLPYAVLRESDFTDGQLVQCTDDLTNPAMFAKHRALFEQADLIFIDAAKDGVMEQTFLDHFATVKFRTAPLMVFDDIRLWNMLRI